MPSQMAHGSLQQLEPSCKVHSAGVRPAREVHPLAGQVMKEIGIDLNQHYPKQVDRYLNEPWDYVITVCGDARETCPLFSGEVRHRLHIGFDDPDAFTGTPEEIITEFRRVRDEIRASFEQLAQAIREEES